MKQFITVARIRSVIDGAKTEKDAADALRRHRIRYMFSTAGGFFHIRIPVRSGIVIIARTARRSAPLVVSMAAPGPYPFPVPRWTWDD